MIPNDVLETAADLSKYQEINSAGVTAALRASNYLEDAADESRRCDCRAQGIQLPHQMGGLSGHHTSVMACATVGTVGCGGGFAAACDAAGRFRDSI